MALLWTPKRWCRDLITLVDFSNPDEFARWSPIDDVVMGGRSRSGLDFDAQGHAIFSGVISFENNGGFASVRRHPGDLGNAAVVAYVLAVRGDGRRYKFSVRTDDGFDGINYQCGFHPPADVWTSMGLSCDGFVPTWRGRRLDDRPPLDPAQVRQVGFLIAERQDGPFALAIRAIGIDLKLPGGNP